MYREVKCLDCRATWITEMYPENGHDEFVRYRQSSCQECGSDNIELGDLVPKKEILIDRLAG